MQPQTYRPTEVLRLEVEEEQTGLANGIANPSGEFGGWGWLTPVANTAMTSSDSPRRLQFTTTVSQAVYFTSEPMPVTPGHYVGGRLTLGGTNDSPTVRYVRGRVDFLDAAGALLSSGAWSAYTSTIDGTVLQVTGVVAPPSTAFAVLRVGFYSSNLGGNPAAGAWLRFHSAVLATSPTAGELGTVRTNLFARPTFEVASLGLYVQSGNSGGTGVSTQTVIVFAGARALQLERLGGTSGDINALMAGGVGAMPVEPFRDYSMSLKMRSSLSTFVNMRAEWYGSGFEFLSSELVYLANPDNTGWIDVSGTATAPAGAAYLRIRISTAVTVPLNSRIYVDQVLVEQSSTVGTYFDGGTPDAGGIDYAWTGTAHESTSTATVPGDLPYIPPVSYLNVLGPSHSIEVTRQALQVGELRATIRDVTLAPYQAAGIRQGRACRLLMLTAADEWVPLFTGEVDVAEVTFDRRRLAGGGDDPKRALVQITAVDNSARLAGTPRAEGVATVAELPYVLEGAGVPWCVNGSGAQVATADVTTYNENASALDQVALTRDTELGYAWVDKRGVLNVYDAASMPGQELLTNPSFEDGTLTGWTIGGNVTGSVINYTAGEGAKAAQVTWAATPPGGASGNLLMSSAIPVTPGEHLVGSGRVNRTSSVPPASVRLLLLGYTAAGAFLRTIVQTDAIPTNVSPAMSLAELEVVVPADVGQVRLAWYRAVGDDGSTWTSGGMRFDAHSLRTSEGALGEDRYSGIDLGYDSRACINTVTVVAQQIDPVTGSTEEVQFGPYVDADSVREYGTRAETFTIAPGVIDETAAAAYADTILTANAVPLLRADQVTAPILDRALHMSDVPGEQLATLDLYDRVRVTNSSEAFDRWLRVTSIVHRFTARARKSEGPTWTMTLGFTADATVASPTRVPPPAAGSAGKTLAQLLRPVGEVSMWFGAKVDCPAGWLVMDGSAIPAEYPELIALVGATLPNMTDVMPVGAGTKALGAAGGSATKVIGTANLPPHSHSMTHTHPVPRKANVGSSTGYARGNATSEPNDDTNASSQSQTGDGPGTSTPLDVMPPWRALWFIIRAK